MIERALQSQDSQVPNQKNIKQQVRSKTTKGESEKENDEQAEEKGQKNEKKTNLKKR